MGKRVFMYVGSGLLRDLKSYRAQANHLLSQEAITMQNRLRRTARNRWRLLFGATYSTFVMSMLLSATTANAQTVSVDCTTQNAISGVSGTLHVDITGAALYLTEIKGQPPVIIRNGTTEGPPRKVESFHITPTTIDWDSMTSLGSGMSIDLKGVIDRSNGEFKGYSSGKLIQRGQCKKATPTPTVL